MKAQLVHPAVQAVVAHIACYGPRIGYHHRHVCPLGREVQSERDLFPACWWTI